MSLLTIFIALAQCPVVMHLRLPKSLVPPDTAGEPGYTEYRNSLLAVLQVNPNLKGFQSESVDDIPNAIAVLSGQVDVGIKNAASSIFVSTEVMQNERLDGLILLITHARLVWQMFPFGASDNGPEPCKPDVDQPSPSAWGYRNCGT